MSAASVSISTVSAQETGPGSTPRAALHDIQVKPIPISVAKQMIVRHHYLHSIPGGTCLTFGTFVRGRLLGVITLGVGPFNAHSLVEDAAQNDCLTLTRLWLSDDLPVNTESRVLGITVRALKRHTGLKFLVTYADPAQGHVGTIYQASGWLYTGLSEPTPLYDLDHGNLRHCRSVATFFGTRSVRHLTACGVRIKLVPQVAKHRYVYFLDPTKAQRLKVPVLPHPKKEGSV